MFTINCVVYSSEMDEDEIKNLLESTFGFVLQKMVLPISPDIRKRVDSDYGRMNSFLGSTSAENFDRAVTTLMSNSSKIGAEWKFNGPNILEGKRIFGISLFKQFGKIFDPGINGYTIILEESQTI